MARNGYTPCCGTGPPGGDLLGSDHFGISLAVGDGRELPAAAATAARRRRPDLDPDELIAPDWERLHRQLDAYLDAGLSKFVIRPIGGGPLDGFVDRFVGELLDRQN